MSGVSIIVRLMLSVKESGGSVTVWACFFSRRPGNLDKVQRELSGGQGKWKRVFNLLSDLLMTQNMWPNQHRIGSTDAK